MFGKFHLCATNLILNDAMYVSDMWVCISTDDSKFIALQAQKSMLIFAYIKFTIMCMQCAHRKDDSLIEPIKGTCKTYVGIVNAEMCLWAFCLIDWRYVQLLCKFVLRGNNTFWEGQSKNVSNLGGKEKIWVKILRDLVSKPLI